MAQRLRAQDVQAVVIADDDTDDEDVMVVPAPGVADGGPRRDAGRSITADIARFIFGDKVLYSDQCTKLRNDLVKPDNLEMAMNAIGNNLNKSNSQVVLKSIHILHLLINESVKKSEIIRQCRKNMDLLRELEEKHQSTFVREIIALVQPEPVRMRQPSYQNQVAPQVANIARVPVQNPAARMAHNGQLGMGQNRAARMNPYGNIGMVHNRTNGMVPNGSARMVPNGTMRLPPNRAAGIAQNRVGGVAGMARIGAAAMGHNGTIGSILNRDAGIGRVGDPRMGYVGLLGLAQIGAAALGYNGLHVMNPNGVVQVGNDGVVRVGQNEAASMAHNRAFGMGQYGPPRMGQNVAAATGAPGQNGAIGTTGVVPANRRSNAFNANVRIDIFGDSKYLWKALHGFTHEMHISRRIKSLYPEIVFTISGLEPQKNYSIRAIIFQVDDNRYEYRNDTLTPVGPSGVPPLEIDGLRNSLWHKDETKTGREWMSSSIAFEKLRITLKEDLYRNRVMHLQLGHKYNVALAVHESAKKGPLPLVNILALPYTEFITTSDIKNLDVAFLKQAVNKSKTNSRELRAYDFD